MKLTGSILLLCLLCSFAHSLINLSSQDLKLISLQGQKHIDKEIDDAIEGVKQMKTLMEKSEKQHKAYLKKLDKTKQQKEEAIKVAEEIEVKLNEAQKVCNESIQALWEECKPCLKQSCIRYYSRTCSSASGAVGRRLEEYLNKTSPISIWINGEKLDSLLETDKKQEKQFEDLEEHYAEIADGVDSIFQDSEKVFDHIHSPFRYRMNFGYPMTTPLMSHRMMPFYQMNHPDIRSHFFGHGFHDMFKPMFDMVQRMFDSVSQITEKEFDLMDPFPTDGSVNEDVIISRPNGNNQMTCREIRRNSAGCLNLKEECEKCKAIQSIDCSGKKPLQGPLKEEFENSLAIMEKLTKEYDEMLKKFQQEILNTTDIMKRLNEQFGWVSTLVNATDRQDGFFQITTVMSRNSQNPNEPGDTTVTTKFFDLPEMTFTVPKDIPWDDPKFSEIIAKEAVEYYKKNVLIVK
ncbi:CLUS protein, partial [Polypterus senegalus]|nr:clusterin [Polypterus senegalus]MBN3292230.1 CLUS protein [Polypterus senegalus]